MSHGRFEDYPLTRQEYISVMVHFYRGEVHRSTTWRQRLDATTNWAVVTMAAMLSFTFANPETPHILLLLSNLVVLSYLIIEGRRYRYFEVYRARVRMLEENFLIPVITRQLESPMPVKSTASITPNAMDERVKSVRRRLRQRFSHAIEGSLARFMARVLPTSFA